MRWLNKLRIRRRITTPPFYEDFLDVKARKSSWMAIYMQERCSGNRVAASFYRTQHLMSKGKIR